MKDTCDIDFSKTAIDQAAFNERERRRVAGAVNKVRRSCSDELSK